MKEILEKLIDNFNLGKFFSDLISGSVLAFSLFLLVGLATGVRVFPAEDVPMLERQLDAKRAAYTVQSAHVRRILVVLAKTEVAVPEAGDAAALEDSARTAIAESTKQEQKPYLARLNADLAGMATIKSDMDDMQRKLARAHTLAGNVTSDSASLALFLAVSLICGVVISQVARIAFVRFVYVLLFLRADQRPGPANVCKLNSEDLRKTNDYIVTYYYRYAECGANLAIPLVLTAFIAPWFLASRGLVASPAALTGLKCGLIMTAIVVFVAGGFAYRLYRQKLKENIGGLAR